MRSVIGWCLRIKNIFVGTKLEEMIKMDEESFLTDLKTFRSINEWELKREFADSKPDEFNDFVEQQFIESLKVEK